MIRSVAKWSTFTNSIDNFYIISTVCKICERNTFTIAYLFVCDSQFETAHVTVFLDIVDYRLSFMADWHIKLSFTLISIYWPI